MKKLLKNTHSRIYHVNFLKCDFVENYQLNLKTD